MVVNLAMTKKIARVTVAAACLAVTAMFAVGCSKTQEAAKDVASTAASAASSAPGKAAMPEGQADGGAAPAAGTTTLYYPEQQGAIFSVVAPDDWAVTKADKVGDFVSLESVNGSILQFRERAFSTEAEGTKEVDSIVNSTMDFLNDNYTDIKLSDPEDITIDGQPGFAFTGDGKDKDGNAVKFVSATVVLDTSRIVEIWAAVYGEGNNDGDTASKVLDSLKLTPAQPAGAN
ncbi:MAG: hypothetical protein ACOYO2_07415 [Mycobacterium sp.]|jgi:hypothetical protein